MLIEIRNHGPLIVATNYWETPLEAAGNVFCSVNAGAIRLLVPRSHRLIINQMRCDSRYAILSRGPWPEMMLDEAVEIMLEDGSDSPFALHLSPQLFDSLPGEPAAGREWVFSVWDCKRGRPHKALERICYWRRVPQLPWMQPWQPRSK